MRRTIITLTAVATLSSFLTFASAAAVATEDIPVDPPLPATPLLVAVGGSSVISNATFAHLNVCVPDATRLSGSDRYATGRAVLGMESVSGGTVFVTQGKTFADALPAGAAANAAGSALVLVEPNSIPGSSQAALDSIAPDRIVIVGGTAAVSESVESALRTRYGDVVRVSGGSRYTTATAVSQYQYPSGASAVIVATGDGFIDALAAAPLSAYKNAPLLLVPKTTVPPEVVAEIQRLTPTEIFVIGGTAVVSNQVQQQLTSSNPTANVTRIAGSDRYATAREIARYLPEDPDRLIAVTAYNFPDALAAGSVSRTNPLILIDQQGLNGTSAAMIANAASSPCAPIVKLSEFTTYYPAGQSRVTNIHLIADEADNSVVLPGDTWSLNDTVGIRKESEGYVAAGAIIGGRLYCCDSPTNIGGGTSQFATTLYNAIFYGALEDIYHRPHSIYFSRYPLGIEATLGWPLPDVVFRNDTDWPVLVDSSYTSRSVTVEMWGWNDERKVTQKVTGSATTTTGGTVSIERTITYQDGTSSTQRWTHKYNPLKKDDPTPAPTPTPTPTPEPRPGPGPQ